MLAVERLYRDTQEILKQSKLKKLEEAFLSLKAGQSVLTKLLSFLSLIDEAVSEVEACQFRREEKQARFLLELTNFRAKLLERLLMRDRAAVSALFSDGDVERLGAISEAVTEVLDDNCAEIDRANFAEETKNLIDEIRKWDIGDYGKRSLLLSLNMLISQSNAARTSFSDTQIRRRIKSVVADFAVEFVALDREFETRFEKIKRWARLGYVGSPTPLGLTLRASRVAGLLPKP